MCMRRGRFPGTQAPYRSNSQYGLFQLAPVWNSASNLGFQIDGGGGPLADQFGPFFRVIFTKIPLTPDY